MLVYGCACECVYEFKHNFLCNAFASHTHSLLAISTTSSFWFHMQFQLACANVCAYSFLFVLWIFVYFIAVIIRCPVAVVVIIDCLLCFVFFCTECVACLCIREIRYERAEKVLSCTRIDYTQNKFIQRQSRQTWSSQSVQFDSIRFTIECECISLIWSCPVTSFNRWK